MRNLWKGGLAILGVIAISTVGITQALAQARAWLPEPTELPAYVNPHKPLTKLSEVLADKNPSVSWRHQVVNDSSLKASWVGLKPGDATRTKQVADHQSAFIVWSGSVQVAIQGQTTFIATQGHIIRVPFRLTYTLTNVGSTPSLHLEIFDARRIFLYPQAQQICHCPRRALCGTSFGQMRAPIPIRDRASRFPATSLLPPEAS